MNDHDFKKGFNPIELVGESYYLQTIDSKVKEKEELEEVYLRGMFSSLINHLSDLILRNTVYDKEDENYRYKFEFQLTRQLIDE